MAIKTEYLYDRVRAITVDLLLAHSACANLSVLPEHPLYDYTH